MLKPTLSSHLHSKLYATHFHWDNPCQSIFPILVSSSYHFLSTAKLKWKLTHIGGLLDVEGFGFSMRSLHALRDYFANLSSSWNQYIRESWTTLYDITCRRKIVQRMTFQLQSVYCNLSSSWNQCIMYEKNCATDDISTALCPAVGKSNQYRPPCMYDLQEENNRERKKKEIRKKKKRKR